MGSKGFIRVNGPDLEGRSSLCSAFSLPYVNEPVMTIKKTRNSLPLCGFEFFSPDKELILGIKERPSCGSPGMFSDSIDVSWLWCREDAAWIAAKPGPGPGKTAAQ